MTTVLLVANQTIAGDRLAEQLTARLAGELTVHLVVPINPHAGAASGRTYRAGDVGGASDADLARAVAEQRLALGLQWLRGLGASATGEIETEHDTPETVRHLVDRHGADEVIVSTLDSKVSRWLHQDLPHKIQRRIDVPVEVVTATD